MLDRPATPLLRLPGVALLMGAAFISNLGNWVQIFTEQWTVLSLAGPEASRWAGRMGFAMGIALLLFGTYGGGLGDRFPRRRLVAVAQLWMGLLGLGLAFLAWTGGLTLQRLVGFAGLTGLGVAVSSPVFWTLVADQVPPERVAGTFALMTAQWNLSRVIGPVVAAWLMPLVGTAGNFLLNALSFFILVGVVLRLGPGREIQTPERLGSFREALALLGSHRRLRHIMILAALAGGLGWCYATFLPLYGSQYLGFGERGVAWLYSVFGVGALAGALVMAREGQRDLGQTMRRGFLIFAVGLLVLALKPHPWLSQAALLAMGFAQATALTSMSSQIQILAPAHLRSRLNGLYVTGIIGLTPLGDLLCGEVGQVLGFHGPRIVEAAVGMLLVGVLGWLGRPGAEGDGEQQAVPIHGKA